MDVFHPTTGEVRSDLSRPFGWAASPSKVINHLGDEVMKVFRV